MDKMPPVEKVYEAWSAIADGRVSLMGDDKARVLSSDGTKTYTVVYDKENDTFLSNDNATFWRGYAGYPVIAMMMVKGMLPMDSAYCQQWGGVNWTALNKAHKRDYKAAVEEVERERGIDSAEAERRAEAVMDTLKALPLKVKRLSGVAQV